MTWRENGWVGIGTKNPNYPLEVVSSGNTLRARCTGSGIGVYTSSSSGFGIYSDAPENFLNGLTGFAQTNPTHRVTVNGAIGIQQSGTTKFHLNYYNNGFNISETNVADYRFYVKEGGNVGIGTSNPTKKLHVNGDVNVGDTLYAGALQADLVKADNIVNEVGIASVAGDVISQDVTTSWSPYLTCEITVPDGGYVLAIGTALFILDHGISGNTEAMLACSDMANSLNGSYYQMFGLFTDVSAGTYFASVTTQRLFSVPSQGTYTYYLIAEREPDNPVSIRYKQMRLLYIATHYGSKNGEPVNALPDEINMSEIMPNLEPEQTGSVLSGNRKTDSEFDGGISALVGRIDALTTEIEALKRRFREAENE
jgi:hypothetical protein